MKRLNLLLFCCVLILATACKKDNDGTILSYDGDNVSGPLLEVGTHEAGVRFISTDMTPHVGKELTEVRFFMGPQAPAGCTVKIYGEGSADIPGSLLYSQDVTNSLIGQDWNDHVLSTPLEITEQDYWISIELEHTVAQQSIGCDAGPAKSNGDWLYSIDSEWKTYRDRTTESVNWNIRVVVSEKE